MQTEVLYTQIPYYSGAATDEDGTVETENEEHIRTEDVQQLAEGHEKQEDHQEESVDSRNLDEHEEHEQEQTMNDAQPGMPHNQIYTNY